MTMKGDDEPQQSAGANRPSTNPPSAPPSKSAGAATSGDGAASPGPPPKAARKGKWSAEEEEFTTRIIECFNSGLLSLPDGTTLRSYLAEKLSCDPMRITKKFSGSSCLGKRVFHSSLGGAKARTEPPASAADIARAHQELAVLENRFIDACIRSTESKDARMIDLEARFLHSSNVVSTPAIDAFIMQSCQPLWDPDGVQSRAAVAAAHALGSPTSHNVATSSGESTPPHTGASPLESPGLEARAFADQAAQHCANAPQHHHQHHHHQGHYKHFPKMMASTSSSSSSAPPSMYAFGAAAAHHNHHHANIITNNNHTNNNNNNIITGAYGQEPMQLMHHLQYAPRGIPTMHPMLHHPIQAHEQIVEQQFQRQQMALMSHGRMMAGGDPQGGDPQGGDHQHQQHHAMMAWPAALGGGAHGLPPNAADLHHYQHQHHHQHPGGGQGGDKDASVAADLFHGFVKSLHRSDSHNDLVDFVEDVNEKAAKRTKTAA